MGKHSHSVAWRVSRKRSPWVPALMIAMLFLATATAGAETGLINLKVTDDDILVQDAGVSIHTPSGESLDMPARTNKAGIATFVVPAGSYKFYVDHCGDRIWSDVVHTLPNEETEVELALEQLIEDKTLDPHPVRFDGTPPEKEPVMLASLVDLSGILTQSTVATVNRDRLYWYINDHLGAPMMIVDENQAVVWQGSAAPFGETAITVNTIENNFRFPGQYFDTESGLHYNHHRYYDYLSGRYVTADPIGLAGGINLYAYTNLNPINKVDPLGLEVLSAGMISEYTPKVRTTFNRIETSGSWVFSGYTTNVYKSGDGGFWKWTDPEQATIAVSTTVIGGDLLRFVFKTDEPEWSDCPAGDSTVSFGAGRFVSISYTPSKNEVSFNFGIGLAPPVQLSVPLEQPNMVIE